MSGSNQLLLMSSFSGMVAGQIAYVSPGTYSFVVPNGVTAISVVAVAAGGGVAESSVKNGATALCSIIGASTRVGDGGGNGGASGGTQLSLSSGYNMTAGGGGAGGYTGNGGQGGYWVVSYPNVWFYCDPGTGGGGGGGYLGSYYYGQSDSGGGGGVGLLGQGANGAAANNYMMQGYGGSGSTSGGVNTYNGGLYGGGQGCVTDGAGNVQGSAWAYGGGGLSYKNNITVTPGQTLTVKIDSPTGYAAQSGGGAVRIIWGYNRAFPSTNTGDV